MDPNVVHQDMIEAFDHLSQQRNDADASTINPFDPDDVCRLLDAVEALDVWISSGGFPPSAWLKP